MEREEVYRLKRFKQLKTKRKTTEAHICCCCLSMFASEEDVVESTCPVCKKAAKAKGKSSDIRLNVVPCKSAIGQVKENKKLLDHLMSHIDDVIDLTRQYKLDGIVPASIDKFIKTCSQVKETIEDYANAPPLCDVCKKFLETTSSKVKLASRTGSSKSLNIPCSPKSPGQAPPCTESCYNLNPETDDKLGYFEKKFKEIVKVTRLQNEDGSVSEEKQVITIRTERRNPRKTGTFHSKFDDEKFVGPGGGRSGSNNYGGGKDHSCGNDYSSGKDYGGGTDYGGDGGPDFQQGPRETKSEHVNRSHQMGEPRLRSCISASHLKSTLKKDASTNFDSRGCVSAKTSKVTLPPSTSTEKAKNICGPLPKVSKTSSVDSHICCPRKTASVCGSALESGPHSQASINSCSDQVVSCKPVTASASAQTCCREVPVKKHKEDKGTCCLPTCGGEMTCLDNKDNKFKTTSTEAIWRDAWTSTTDLNIEPSKTPSKRSSKAASSKASPVPSCASKASNDSNSDDDTAKRKKRGNCCTIKIIAKPPKICCLQDEPKEPEKEVILPGSMFEQIKSIFLPPTKSNESCHIKPEESEIKNICTSCVSKLNSFAKSSTSKPSVKSQSSSCKNICTSCLSKMSSVAKSNTDSKPSVKSQSSSFKNTCTSCLSKMSSFAKSNTDSKSSVKSQSSSCKICQASVPSEEEVKSCPSCGSLAQASSCGSMSCKSMGIGSSTSHTCSIRAPPEPLHKKRHTCCLEKKKNNSSDEEDENTCCAMAQTNKSSKSICCSKKKSSSVCCPAKASVSSIKSTKSTSASCNMKADASTCTKRSARFDVRPVSRHTCEKVKLGSCTCKSDSHLDRSRGGRRPVKRSQSFYEDEYYYFKW